LGKTLSRTEEARYSDPVAREVGVSPFQEFVREHSRLSTDPPQWRIVSELLGWMSSLPPGAWIVWATWTILSVLLFLYLARRVSR
jgi:hypothetical protein